MQFNENFYSISHHDLENIDEDGISLNLSFPGILREMHKF